MPSLDARLQQLLERINGGQASAALRELDRLLKQHPGQPAVLALRAEALRLTGQLTEAIAAFRQAGEAGAGPRNWLAAGILLAAERDTEGSIECLKRALTESPASDDVLDALITTLFNANRHAEGLEYARRQLTISANPTFLSRAALLLQSVDLYEEATSAFRRILELAPSDPALVGAALVPARFTCDWDWIEELQRRINESYARGDFAAPQEYPLTHLTWCADEARNLGVTRAYVKRMVPVVEPVARPPRRGRHSRLRVGYMSCDFRNHATMHLMAGLFEAHDRSRFEVFAYDYSSFDVSDYRTRFVNAIEHLIPIHTLSDKQAALRIAQDELDILFDLKLYTGGGRPGILAYRPAALQVAYIGYPGSAASADIDYIVSDRFITPDASTPHYTEAFCRLPHSYQCNDRKRFRAAAPGSRAMHGLPDDKIVFGAFNQSYKVDRASFAVWMRILKEVPDSVLWMLGQGEAAIANLARQAQASGIDPKRVLFAPFAQPWDHLARLQLADAVLDTLICNGHTTTSDALWAGVPVITARGRHFASRVSESLLRAHGMPELVAEDADAMVSLARRIGTDAKYRQELRARVDANRFTAPLFDTARFTRDFETAIAMMVEQQASGGRPPHIDVPDAGAVKAEAQVQAPGSASPARGAGNALQEPYSACPLCNGAHVTLGSANCTAHALWHAPLPPTIEWLRCMACDHVHSRYYWTAAGLEEVRRNSTGASPGAAAAAADDKRALWSPVIERASALLGGYGALARRPSKPVWVDVGCADGALVMTAADCGFAAVGLDTRAEPVGRIQQLGFTALNADFMTLKFEVIVDVLSMMDVLGQLRSPLEALRKAAQVVRPGGVLIISTPDRASSSWRAMDSEKVNPYWIELEHHHHFTRERLTALLAECGFELADFAIPSRYKAQMELYAVRKAI